MIEDASHGLHLAFCHVALAIASLALRRKVAIKVDKVLFLGVFDL